jgi:hypothetical protein
MSQVQELKEKLVKELCDLLKRYDTVWLDNEIITVCDPAIDTFFGSNEVGIERFETKDGAVSLVGTHYEDGQPVADAEPITDLMGLQAEELESLIDAVKRVYAKVDTKPGPVQITDDEFYTRFKPEEQDECWPVQRDFCVPEDVELLEQARAENRIWTQLECDDDVLVLASGYHYVNALYYVITAMPWDADYEIKTDLKELYRN